MKRSFWGGLNLVLFFVSCLLYLFFVFAGFSLFYSGFHNVDVASNFMGVEDYFNLYLADRGVGDRVELFESWVSSSSPVGLVDAYKLGLRQLVRGFFVVLWGSLGFGFSLACIVFRGGGVVE